MLSSSDCEIGWLSVGPGGVFVVGGAGSEAAVEVCDEAVGACAHHATRSSRPVLAIAPRAGHRSAPVGLLGRCGQHDRQAQPSDLVGAEHRNRGVHHELQFFRCQFLVLSAFEGVVADLFVF